MLAGERNWRRRLYQMHLDTVRDRSRTASTVRTAYRELLTYRHELAVLGDVRSLGVGYA
jgi:hypothetical protein